MPISQINPDGTVRIFNRKTGEVKDVAPENLAQYSPKLVGSYEQMQRDQEQYRTLLDAGVSPDQLPADQAVRNVLTQQVSSGGYSPPKSDAQQKRIDEDNILRERAQDVLSILNQGEKGEVSGEEFTTALEVAAARYNAAAGFGEGGTSFTESEQALLAGSILTPEIKKPNIIQRGLGQVPPQTGRILNTPEEIRDKMQTILKITGDGDKTQADTIQTPIEQSQGFQNIEPGAANDLVMSPNQSTNEEAVQSAIDPNSLVRGGEKSIGGFTSNVISDVGENIQGLASLPGIAQKLVSGEVPVDQAIKAVLNGVVDEYSQLIQHPIDTTYEKPVTTLLNVLPVLEAANVAKTKYLGTASKAADELGDVSKTAKILEKASTVEDLQKVSPVARSVYQGTLAISRKGNAFERLKPAQTVSSMIKYGISGSADDIYRTTQQVTGPKGIISGVVNDVVGQVEKPINTRAVTAMLKESKQGRFSALTPEKIDEVATGVRSLPSNQVGGEVDASRLLDYERQLQSEAVQHRIAGFKGDTAASEYSKLKFEAADIIGKLIDEASNEAVDISQYKNPAILDVLRKISPKLAQDYEAAKTVSELRSLQRDFVRMSQMIELAQNEPSGLGRRLFGSITRIPVVGPGVDAALNELAVPFGTKTGVALDRLSPAIEAVQSATLNPYTITGSREANQGLNPGR